MKLGEPVQPVEIVGRVIKVRAPVEAQPMHRVDDGIDVLLLFLLRVGVVEAQVASGRRNRARGRSSGRWIWRGRNAGSRSARGTGFGRRGVGVGLPPRRGGPPKAEWGGPAAPVVTRGGCGRRNITPASGGKPLTHFEPGLYRAQPPNQQERNAHAPFVIYARRSRCLLRPRRWPPLPSMAATTSLPYTAPPIRAGTPDVTRMSAGGYSVLPAMPLCAMSARSRSTPVATRCASATSPA